MLITSGSLRHLQAVWKSSLLVHSFHGKRGLSNAVNSKNNHWRSILLEHIYKGMCSSVTCTGPTSSKLEL